MKPNLKILFVEDLASDFELIKREIKKSEIEFVDQLVETKEAYKEALLSFKPDIILSDYSLPQFDGMQALEIRQKVASHTPFILITGALNEETAVEIMKAGSDDYILKQNLTRLVPAIKSTIEKWEIIKAKKQAEKALIESGNILNRTSEMAKVGGWEFDLQTKTPFMTLETCRIFEVPPPALKGPIETAIKFYDAQAQPIIRDAIEAAIDHGIPYDLELPFTTAKGRHIWVRSKGHAEMKNGKTTKLIGSIQDITDRKKIEISLHESEEIYRAIVENSHDAIFIYKDNNFLFVNDKASELSGYSREEFNGMIIWDIIHPDDRKRIEKYGEKRIALEEAPISYQARIIVKNNAIRICEFAVRIIPYQNDFAILGAVRDITKNHQAEKALRESEQKFRDLANLLPLVVYEVDTTGKLVYLNNEGFNTFGVTDKDLERGINVLDNIAPKDRDRAMKSIQNRLRGGEIGGVEYTAQRKDGTTLPVVIYASPILSDAKIIGLRGVIMDNTVRKQSEDALKKSEQQYRDFFEKDISGSFLSTPEGKLINCNPAFSKMLGYTTSEITKIDTKLLYPHPTNRKEFIDRLTKNKNLHSLEINLVKKDGKIITCVENVVGSFDSKGKLIKFQGYIVDITERKKAEKALRESEQKYRSLFDKSADALLIIDNDQFIDCNPATVKMLGYKSREEIINTHPSQLSPVLQADGRDSFEKSNEMMAIAYKKGSHRFEWLHKRQNGEVFPAEVLLTAIPIGDKSVIHVVWRDITDRKIADKALRESEEKYKSLFDTANDAIFVMKNDIFIACNQKTLEIFGCFEDEIIGYSPTMYSPEHQPDGMLSKEKADIKIKNALSGKPQFFEWTHQRKNGIPFDAEVSLNRMLLSDGEYIHAIVRNIDERKLAERALKENENRLSTLISNLPGMTYLGKDDEHWTMLYLNGACEKLTGYRPEQIINNKEISYLEIIHPDDREQVQKQIHPSKIIGKHFELEYRIMTAEGVTKWVWERGVHRPSRDGKVLLTEGVIDDITERVLSKHKLVESEEKYHGMIMNLMEGFYSATVDGKLTEYNTEFIKILGLDPNNNYLGLELPDFWEDPSERKKYVHEFLTNGYVKNYTVKIRRDDGSLAIVQINSRLIKDESGKTSITEGTLLDITDRVLAEESLKQSEIQLRNLTAYMDKKTENEKKIIAKEIHDGLGQLLTGLKMDLQWINKKYPKESAVLKRKLTSMNNIIDSAVTDVQKLTFSLRPKMLDELGLVETIQSEAEHFAERTGISCSVWFSQETFDVEYNSSSAIYRIMMELLTNIYRHARASEVEIKLEKIKNKCIFTITDNGIGISQDQIESRNSFGLISITERANVLNGSIKIQGKPNTGTTVRVVIPL